MLFDTHTHSYFPDLAFRQDEIVAEMIRNKVCYATQIGCDLETSKKAIELAKKYDQYYATIGYHPTDGQSLSQDMISKIIEELEMMLILEYKYIVAIGETGFDYYHLDPETADEQKKIQKILFFSQVELAIRYELPIVIHTRDAREDTLRYIKESGIKKAIIHCFSEDYEFAQELMAYSDEIMFSFSGIVTYKKSIAIQEAARLIPLSKILIETDAPFLSPQIVRGSINEPANVRYILEKIQDLRDEDVVEIERVIYENSLQIYKIVKNIAF